MASSDEIAGAARQLLQDMAVSFERVADVMRHTSGLVAVAHRNAGLGSGLPEIVSPRGAVAQA